MGRGFDVMREMKEGREFKLPVGFSLAKEIDRSAIGSIEELRAKKMAVPNKGEFATNNGHIAAVNSKGEIGVWIPKSDPNDAREVSYQQAIQALKDAGFKHVDSSFHVPFS